MKFIKKNKVAIFILLLVVAVVAAFFILKDTVMFDESTAVYGNRLDGIDKVEITSDQKKEIKEVIKDSSESVEFRLAGKIVYITIESLPETTLQQAKDYTKPILEVFSEDQKKFYDFQFLITNSENTSQYPIIGYRQHSRESISWTKDREKVEG